MLMVEQKKKPVKVLLDFYHNQNQELEDQRKSQLDEKVKAQEKIRIENAKKRQLEMEKQRKLEEEKLVKLRQEREEKRKQIETQLKKKQEKDQRQREKEEKKKSKEIDKILDNEINGLKWRNDLSLVWDLESEEETAKKEAKIQQQELTRKLLELDFGNDQEETSSENFTDTEKANSLIQEAKNILQTEKIKSNEEFQIIKNEFEPEKTASEKAQALLLEAENILLDLKSKKSEAPIGNQAEKLSTKAENPTLPLIFSQSELQKVRNFPAEDSSSSSSELSQSTGNNFTEEILNRYAFKKYKQNLIESFEREFEYKPKKDEEEIPSSESNNSSKLSTPPPSFETATATATAFQNLDLDSGSDAAMQIPLLTLVQKSGMENPKERESSKIGQLPVIEKEGQIINSSTTNLSEGYGENLLWGENNDCDCCPLLTCIFACIFQSSK